MEDRELRAEWIARAIWLLRYEAEEWEDMAEETLPYINAALRILAYLGK